MNNRSGFFSVNKVKIQECVALACCIGMVAGLMWSRALLSICMVVLFVNALWTDKRYSAWAKWKQSRFSQFSAGFFFIYLISGLWSTDLDSFWSSALNKLPFFILPFAFFTIPLHKIKYQRLVMFAIVIMHLTVVLYSLFSLWQHPEFYIEGYVYSRPLPTTKYNDHIRFSITLVMTVVMACYLLFDKRNALNSKWLKAFLIAVVILFIAYIHVLAAKSGLICLYLFLMVYGFYLLFRKHKLLAFLLVVLLLLMPVLMYRLVPTFQKKIDYVAYEIDKYQREQHFDYSLSDGGRMITYDIGLRAIARHPMMGVGAGDLMDEMRKGYAIHYPEVPPYEHYGPINQFLYTTLCVGIPLALILVAMVLIPFNCRGHYQIYISLTAAILLFCLMVEAMLEIQFGVFVYLFFLLFWLSIYQEDRFRKTTKLP